MPTRPTTGVWVTADCRSCGRIQLRPDAYRITVSGETYTYTCPTCSTLVEKPATPAVIHMLIRASWRAHYLATHPVAHGHDAA